METNTTTTTGRAFVPPRFLFLLKILFWPNLVEIQKVNNVLSRCLTLAITHDALLNCYCKSIPLEARLYELGIF